MECMVKGCWITASVGTSTHHFGGNIVIIMEPEFTGYPNLLRSLKRICPLVLHMIILYSAMKKPGMWRLMLIHNRALPGILLLTGPTWRQNRMITRMGH